MFSVVFAWNSVLLCVVGVYFCIVCGLPCSDRLCMFASTTVFVLVCSNLFVSIVVVVGVDDSDDVFLLLSCFAASRTCFFSATARLL